MAALNVPATAPEANACFDCHDEEVESWKKTDHSKLSRNKKIPHKSLHECGACHDNLEKHMEDPELAEPSSIVEMSKTEQNALCGKCHFNKKLMKGGAINPHGRHGLFMSVGFEEKYKRQLSCLDCHEGHGKHADMLVTMRAHLCFTCHKEAIVTMGIVQPVNYLLMGKACRFCHTVHGESTARQWAYTCVGTYLTVAAACNTCHIVEGAALQWWGP